jgi:acetylglutamate kinase
LKRILFKIGGNVLEELTPSFFHSIHELIKKSYQLLFVHGGGPDIDQILEHYQCANQFEDGLRVTTEEMMSLIEMTLAGRTNRKLVHALAENGIKSIGVHGSDLNLLQADFINKQKYGFVGKILEVEASHILSLLAEGINPVITPIGMTDKGVTLNINADYAAAALASALGVEQCVFVTNVPGICMNDKPLTHVDEVEIGKFINEGKITGGMVPKVQSALAALGSGLEHVRIVSGKEAFFKADNWSGTKISKKEVINK